MEGMGEGEITKGRPSAACQPVAHLPLLLKSRGKRCRAGLHLPGERFLPQPMEQERKRPQHYRADRRRGLPDAWTGQGKSGAKATALLFVELATRSSMM